MNPYDKNIGFSELAKMMGKSKSWLSHILAGRRRINDAQAAQLAAYAPGTVREWWMHPATFRVELESAVRKIRKNGERLPNSEYLKVSRKRRRLRAAVEMIQAWEEG